MNSITARRPTAIVTIEPSGRRKAVPRPHLVKLFVNIATAAPRFAHSRDAEAVVREALLALLLAALHPERQAVSEVSIVSPATDAAGEVGVEGTLLWGGRPEEDGVERLRDVLARAGAKVLLHERRECHEVGCTTSAMVDWNRLADAPPNWYSPQVCQRHNYKTCGRCGSVFLLSSTNTVGQAPSLCCEVCGHVMIGWGRSKVWSAELVTRGTGSGGGDPRLPS